MLSLAAAARGFDVHVYDPDPDPPAGRVSARTITAAYEDLEAVAAFAREVDVVTWEFENVPVETVRAAEAVGALVRPGPGALEVAQDRLSEKAFLRSCGFETAPFARVDDEESLVAALAEVGAPAVLKTRRFGYDGKGQAWIRDPSEAGAAWAAIGARPAILEGAMAFEREVSLVAARSADGAFAAYDLTENRHEGGILAVSSVPASAAAEVETRAVLLVRGLMDRLGYVGVLAVEFFVMPDGRLAANEIAPRVHNSGHWTADACVVGQFEQHIRAVAGWPLGETRRLFAQVEMRNLLGADAADWTRWVREPAARLHLYGKREARPGRKMGHVTLLR